MDFRSYIHNAMLCEELVSHVALDESEVFASEVTLLEAELNELLGLGKVADKLKSLSNKGDKAVEAAKEKGKEVLDTAKYAAGNMAREAKEKITRDATEVAQAHKEIAQAAGKAAVGLFTKSQAMFKELLGGEWKKLTPEQEATMKELEGIFKKMKSGKFLSAPESMSVLATILAKGDSKEFPGYKAYTKQLERLQAIPGMKMVRVAVKNAKAE